MFVPDRYPGYKALESLAFEDLIPGNRLIIEDGHSSSTLAIIHINVLDVSPRVLRARWQTDYPAEIINEADLLSGELRDQDKPLALRQLLGQQARKAAESATVTDEGLIVGCLRQERRPFDLVEDIGVIAVSSNDTEYRLLCEQTINLDSGQLQNGGSKFFLSPIRALYRSL